MQKFITTNIGRLRLTGFLEGISLLILIFIAVPLKYIYGNPALVKVVGQMHGILFLIFVFNTLRVGVEQAWKFKETTWKVLLACVIPFGTFYIDHKILKDIQSRNNE